MTTQNIIEKINVVALDVSAVSGSISREKRDGENAVVFTSGSVRYIDPKHLRAFTAARQAANRVCRIYGVKFLSGWAVPDKNLEKLNKELQEIAALVESAKADLIANWDTYLAEWGNSNPEVAPYRGRIPTKSYVDCHTGASLAVYRIQPQQTEASNIPDGIKTELSGLPARILQEIAQDVHDTWNPSSSQASQRIKNLLSRIRNKFETLAFLGGGLGHLSTFVDEAIKRLPQSGNISGPDFAILAGILSILSSPEEMEKTAAMIEAAGMASTNDIFSAPAVAEAQDEEVAEVDEPVPVVLLQNDAEPRVDPIEPIFDAPEQEIVHEPQKCIQDVEQEPQEPELEEVRVPVGAEFEESVVVEDDSEQAWNW